MTKIVATSDLHGFLPEIPECDILLVAGDVCPITDHSNWFQERWLLTDFVEWVEGVPAKDVVWIAGNHDFVLQGEYGMWREALPGIYLENAAVLVQGLKIYGSPYTPKFRDWAFMKPDSELGEFWREIPEDIDILMVHGPAYGVGDWNIVGEHKHVGSSTLRHQLEYREWPNLKLFVFGHIHEAVGTYPQEKWIEANVAHVATDLENMTYRPANDPVVFELDADSDQSDVREP